MKEMNLIFMLFKNESIKNINVHKNKYIKNA